MTHRGSPGREQPRGRAAVEGMLGGLGEILGKVVELAERAEAAQNEAGRDRGDGRPPRFHVGFNVRTMADTSGEPSISVEPFGDVRRDPASGEARVSECREPPTDVFEEPDGVVVIVEMPGIGAEDASFTLEGDVLTIAAERGEKRYAKEVLLPRAFEQAAMAVTDINGVFEVRLPKPAERG